VATILVRSQSVGGTNRDFAILFWEMPILDAMSYLARSQILTGGAPLARSLVRLALEEQVQSELNEKLESVKAR
jgi:hypothetical protein